jgi:hypothetical protein
MSFPGGSSFQIKFSRARERAPRAKAHSEASLYDRVGRAKARWLNRVMYCAAITPMQKCLAYCVADHLNCVTLDCWPSQVRLADQLGSKCVKTVQRAANALVLCGVLAIKHVSRGSCRYSPVFVEADWTNGVPSTGQGCPPTPATDVHQSSLKHPPQESSKLAYAEPLYDPRKRGAWELKLADKLGPEGMHLLSQLSAHDDRAVDRLCEAVAEGRLGPREVAAARLAIRQYR